MVVKCRAKELASMSYEELQAEHQRLLDEITTRTNTMAKLGTESRQRQPQDLRLTQAAHDYLDVQYYMRHHEDRGEVGGP